MQLKVLDGRHILIKANASTGIDGKRDINFDLPDNTPTKNRWITAKDVIKGVDAGSALVIPVIINRPENFDLQFMPEGGTLIAGAPLKIGFKAIGDDGRGIDVSGKIYNSKQHEVATFTSAYKGLAVKKH